MTDASIFRAKFLAPRYWRRWLTFALLWSVGRVPYRIAMPGARRLGRLAMHLAGSRRRIAEINLALCFPGQDADTRRALIEHHFESLGMGAYEIARCWSLGDRALDGLALEIAGREHLDQALACGKGVLLLAGHFTHLEAGGMMLKRHFEFAAVYRPHDDPLFEAFMGRVRGQHGRAIPRDETRDIIRALRDGLPLWYAPDQHYKGKHGVFAPFFGVPAATNSATGRLAQISRAPVVPFTQSRLPDDRGYRLRFHPPLADFPSRDPERDTARVNGVIEILVRRRPADYLWVHRRFKTRPPGEPALY